MTTRLQRARAIVEAGGVHRVDDAEGRYLVVGGTKDCKTRHVVVGEFCDCADFEYRFNDHAGSCKHISAVGLFIRQAEEAAGIPHLIGGKYTEQDIQDLF